jgi:hypothetical protein
MFIVVYIMIYYQDDAIKSAGHWKLEHFLIFKREGREASEGDAKIFLLLKIY